MIEILDILEDKDAHRPIIIAMRRFRRTKQPTVDLTGVLPPAGLIRWSAWEKAAVVIAVRSGGLGLSEAYDRYMLSDEEFSRWEEAFDHDGIAGLRAQNLAVRVPPGWS